MVHIRRADGRVDPEGGSRGWIPRVDQGVDWRDVMEFERIC